MLRSYLARIARFSVFDQAIDVFAESDDCFLVVFDEAFDYGGSFTGLEFHRFTERSETTGGPIKDFSRGEHVGVGVEYLRGKNLTSEDLARKMIAITCDYYSMLPPCEDGDLWQDAALDISDGAFHHDG